MTTIQNVDYSVDLLRALLWQYNRAEKLESLMTQKQAWYDENQSEFWRSWVRDVFDLRTANDFGLQVWAIILGVPLSISTEPTDLTQPAFAFGTLRQNFERGNYGSSGSGTITLTTELKRLILRLRYFQLVTRCTTPEINRFMASAFAAYGRVYVQDSNDMSFITYVFDFDLSAELVYALEYYDVLPRPATVGIAYIVTTREIWGFGDFNQNYERGTFPPSGLEL